MIACPLGFDHMVKSHCSIFAHCATCGRRDPIEAWRPTTREAFESPMIISKPVQSSDSRRFRDFPNDAAVKLVSKKNRKQNVRLFVPDYFQQSLIHATAAIGLEQR